MVYVAEWEPLADACKRVMAAGASREQAQADICRAIADEAVRIRVRLDRHGLP
jgi:hypothetical protein